MTTPAGRCAFGAAFIYFFLLLATCPLASLALGYEQIRAAEFTSQSSAIPPLTARWREVALPDQWSKDRRWEAGLEGWYRIRLADEQPNKLQAAYIQRVSTNVRAYFNEQYLGSGGRFDEPVARNMHRPLLFSLPTTGWRAEGNYLYLHLRVYPGYAHLAALRIGDRDAVLPAYERQHFIQVVLSQVFYTVVLITALFSALFFAFIERRASNLFFTLAAHGWSIYCLNLFIRDIPMPAKDWWTLIHANLEWTGVFFVLFVHRLVNVRRPWLEGLLIVAATAATVTYALTPLVELNATVRGFHLGLLCVVGYLSLWLLWLYARTRNPDALVVGACLVVVGLLGVNDFVRQAAPIDSPNWQTPFYLLQFGAPLMFVILASHITSRYVLARRRAVEAEARQALARQEERERILQDLHDDVGAKLLTLVYRTEGTESQSLARTALRDIREIVAGQTAQAASLNEVLPPLFADAAKRCAEAGVQWRESLGAVDDLRVSGEFAYQFGKILRELVSNTLRHASAGQVSVALDLQQDALVLSYADDGVGLAPDWEPGMGISGIRRRAQSLAGDVRMTTAAGLSYHVTFGRWGVPSP
ncbi:MAG: 7TM diverse intracellular signaling domain-containing protein [Pseudomonadota bacterium]